MSAKVPLLIEKSRRLAQRDPRCSPITFALPFYRKKFGSYVHRIRSGSLYQIHKRPHMGFTFWCGNTGCVSTENGGELFANPPENAVFCATCEGRATGAGLNGAREICGRTVLYSPRI